MLARPGQTAVDALSTLSQSQFKMGCVCADGNDSDNAGVSAT